MIPRIRLLLPLRGGKILRSVTMTTSRVVSRHNPRGARHSFRSKEITSELGQALLSIISWDSVAFARHKLREKDRSVLSEDIVESLVYEHFLSQATEERVTFVELGAGHGAQTWKFLNSRSKLAHITQVRHVFSILVEPYTPHFPFLIRNMRGCD